MINVLVFPCGSEIGLEVHNALKFDKHIELFGLSSLGSHGKSVYKNYIEGISFYHSENFLDELNKVISENHIDVLIPAYDDIILFLSEHRDEINCKLITSSKITCDICRSKIRTYECFEGEDFIPAVYQKNKITETDLPLFAKPDIGQGSQGVKTIKRMEDLWQLPNNGEGYVICEMLPGKEYTIDCFTNSHGEILCTSMRERIRIKTGISVNSISQATPDAVRTIAERINARLQFDGVWFFQLKEGKNGEYKLLEIAPRVAGSMATSRMRGFNFILNSIYQAMGYEVKTIPNLLEHVEIDRALSCVYSLDITYNYVYMDFDDTITLGNKVNVWVMAFLYQCKNKGKHIILLTRHAREIMDTLKKYSIDTNLFDEITNIPEEKSKSEYIKHKDAIFIDDSFRERYDVSLRCGIPVFDVDGIDALMDWKL